MKLKNFAIAALAAVTTSVPAFARVDNGTQKLLQTLQASGITITVNDDCDGTSHGSYQWAGFKRQIDLCPGSTIDASDHGTVRHEVWHAIQHCVQAVRGGDVTALNDNRHELYDHALKVLGPEFISRIHTVYPRSEWDSEVEAFLAEHALSAADIEQMFRKVCLS